MISFIGELSFVIEPVAGKPRILLACYFNIPVYSDEKTLLSNDPDNLYITPGPGADINPDDAVVKVRDLLVIHYVITCVNSVCV